MKHETVSRLPGLFAFVGIVSAPFFLRTATLLILVGLLAIGFSAGPSALSSSERSMKEGPAVSSRTAALDNSATRLGAFMPSPRTRRYAAWPALPLAPLPVTVETFASNCKTPQTLFSPGDTVCAQVAGSVPGWQLIWSNDRSVTIQTNPINAGNGNIRLTLSPTASLGDWRVIVFDPFGGDVFAVTSFTVADPQNPVVDMQVSGEVSKEAAAGSRVVFGIQVTNGGPDAAAVQLTNAVPANTTWVSFAQLSGPVFSCRSPIVGSTGTSVCTIASLGRREVATFLGTYLVDSSVSSGTAISNTATVTVPVDVVDSNSFNDSSSASVLVVSAPCVLTCPANITVAADPGQSGAFVTYSTPTSNGNCGQPSIGESGENIPAFSCNPASGSFFGMGTATVTCAGQTGGVCSLQVTVENPNGLSISLNGANPLTVECGADFTDPSASAVNRAGQSVPVVITFPQGFNSNAPVAGSYTLTYTATEGQNSTSTTRAVNVTDTAGPQITLAGQNPMTVRIGQTFVDPGVSANDACEGHRSVNSFGTVDTNTPGTYTITYTATDGANRTTTRTRTVIVAKTAKVVVPKSQK